MIGVREAILHILGGVSPLGTEDVPLLEAQGRVLAEDAVAPLDLPAHTNSAMDGYAVRAADVRGASADAPKQLRVIEQVPAGRFPTRPLGPGDATRIFTGAPLPEGSDGVIRQEDTAGGGDMVAVLNDRDAGRNLRLAGEDLRKGTLVFPAGTHLGAAQLGVLASMARSRVRVHRRARVAIIASGDEIADLDEADAILAGRKIASSNSYTLHALTLDAGAVPVPLGIARDTLESVRVLLERGMREADLIVSTAGVSVGEHDFVRDALAALGAEPGFWRVRMRPGSPLGFAHVGGVPWIGLPGNPVSTMVCFELYVRPAIRRMQGERAVFRRTVRAATEEPVRTHGGLTHFLPARLDWTRGEPVVAAMSWQGSGDTVTLARANALLVVPADRPDWETGEWAGVIPR